MSSLGDRMKGYEDVWRATLIRRMPVIVRVDGRAFHSFTRRFDYPWDERLQEAMSAAARALVNEIQGARLAYVQSDEVSVLLVDYNTYQTEPWFGYVVQKVASVASSIATIAFDRGLPRFASPNRGAHFDARAFNLSRDEVVNYFIWRQRDAVRNSILSLGRSHFSHGALHGLSTDEIQEKLFSEVGVNWNDTPVHRKRGWCVLEDGVVDLTPPDFGQDRDYIQALVDRTEEG